MINRKLQSAGNGESNMIFNPSGEVDLLVHNSHDPAYNLACEEYYLCQSERNIIMLWRNAPSVIIGRNQNAYA